MMYFAFKATQPPDGWNGDFTYKTRDSLYIIVSVILSIG